MKIEGLQKLTLLDYPGYTACTVFLSGCNFRCPFCHNAEIAFLPHFPEGKEDLAPVASLPKEREDLAPIPASPSKGRRTACGGRVSTPDLLAFLKKRQGLLDGVCITGGEPTLWPDLPELLQQIKNLGFAVKLDTNGTNPALLQKMLKQQLLDYIAMDIKAGPNNYARLAGTSVDLKKIQTSIDCIRNSGLTYEFRTTVVNPLHTQQDFKEIAIWLQGIKAYYLQPFVLRNTVPNQKLLSPTNEELQRYLAILHTTIPAATIRGRE